MYDEARIINKLHKYTSESYFVGHFATKILKYNEALHVIKTLGEDYRTDAIIENVGECYLNIE